MKRAKQLIEAFDNQARPFLKWVGGKRSILPELLERMPKQYDAYHELFMGGGYKPAAMKWLKEQVHPQKALIGVYNMSEFQTLVNNGFLG